MKMKKFLSYYKPYLKMFFIDMFCAVIAAIITLIYPLIIRYITGEVLVSSVVNIHLIYKLGLFMIVLVIIEYVSNYYISYQGHVMGTYMERDLRNELFEHFQRLSFHFYDEKKLAN